MLYNFSEHVSIANQFIAELRDVKVQSDRMRFRNNMERLGKIIGYEISKTLNFAPKEVETPLGIANEFLPVDRIVIASILRAGIPLHQGLLDLFDYADNAFVSAYRMHHKDGTFEINLQYVSCPDLKDCVLIVVDPMLATGASMSLTIKALEEYGQPASIHVATAIASVSGYNYMKRLYPNINYWIGAIDDELTARSYIVPGLGDAGDLSFGPKVQD